MKNRSVILLAVTMILLISGCTRKKEMVSNHRFAKQTWNRFDILKFDIPVASEGSYDVLLEASHTTEFQVDVFSINMIMVTPSGEERINEYSQRTKRQGKLTGKCSGDSCIIVIPLKKELFLTKGNLKLEIENLIPYIETTGLLGIKIRVVPRG